MQSNGHKIRFNLTLPLILGIAVILLFGSCTVRSDNSTAILGQPMVTLTSIQLSPIPPATQTPILPPTTLPSATAYATAFAATATPSVTPAPVSGQVTLNAGRATVPILLYHHISDAGKTRYFVSTTVFKAQMQFLADHGYQTISVSQVADVIRNGGSLPEKPVVLTFDDGFEDVYQNALPILNAHHFTGVAYIITGTLDSNLSYGYMQSDALKALLAAGWEIGSHSITHTDIQASRLGMGIELRKSRQDLETLLGVPVRSFSYPFGSANPWVQSHVQDYGYDNAVGLDIVVTQTSKRLFYLSRREVYHDLDLKAFSALLVPGDIERQALGLPTETPTSQP